MNILIAGMGRSGSTVIFNIVKELLYSKYDDIYFSHEFDFNEKLCKDINLLKTHSKDYGNWPDIIITTRRDLRDVLSSFKQFHKSYTSGKINEWVTLFMNWHQQWVDKTDYEVIYEKYIRDKSTIIKDISNIIGITDYSEIDIIEKIDNLKNVKNIKGKFDKSTLIHPNHITNKGKIGSYKTTLTDNEIKVVNEIAGEWLKKYGYEK